MFSSKRRTGVLASLKLPNVSVFPGQSGSEARFPGFITLGPKRPLGPLATQTGAH
jgi:hypothetical protein